MSDGNKFLKGFFTAGADISRAKMEAQAKQDEIRAQGAESWKRTVYETESRREESEKERAKDLEVAKIMAEKKKSEQSDFVAAMRGAYRQQPTTAPTSPEPVYQPSNTNNSQATQDLTNEVAPGTVAPTEQPASGDEFSPKELPPSLPNRLNQRGMEIQGGQTPWTTKDSPVKEAQQSEINLQDSFSNVDAEKFAPQAAKSRVESAKYDESIQDKEFKSPISPVLKETLDKSMPEVRTLQTAGKSVPLLYDSEFLGNVNVPNTLEPINQKEYTKQRDKVRDVMGLLINSSSDYGKRLGVSEQELYSDSSRLVELIWTGTAIKNKSIKDGGRTIKLDDSITSNMQNINIESKKILDKYGITADEVKKMFEDILPNKAKDE